MPDIELITPAGIGDVSWVYSKVCCLPAILGKELTFYAPYEWPQRVAPFVELLPNVRFGGYVNVPTMQVLYQSLPGRWPENCGLSPFEFGRPLFLAANFHLESGESLADWLPMLPTEYHYLLNIAPGRMEELLPVLRSGPRLIGVYVSGRAQHEQALWRIWEDADWVRFLSGIAETCRCRYLMIGAEWDRERTEEVGKLLESAGHPVLYLIGQPLETALAAMTCCDYFVSFPSGLGILANVLRVPCLMLLPAWLKPLERTYPDPEDLAGGAYRAWSMPSVEQATLWFRSCALPHLLHGRWG